MRRYLRFVFALIVAFALSISMTVGTANALPPCCDCCRDGTWNSCGMTCGGSAWDCSSCTVCG
jgi:hypothetical protein